VIGGIIYGSNHRKINNNKMKRVLTIGILLVAMAFVAIWVVNYQKRKIAPINLNSEKDGLVYNEATAIKIAEAIWLPIYGGDIYTQKPFTAKLIDSVWVVNGTVHATLGGAPHIKIRKMDGKILEVTHYK
jgi:hypothetical protein